MAANITIKTLGHDDAHLLASVAPEVFDHEPRAHLTSQFLSDSNSHLVVALQGEQIVGFVSAVRYVHPDKAAELFINEVGVTPALRNEGVGQKLLSEMLSLARGLGCKNAWVLTEPSNDPALRLFRALGGKESPRSHLMVEFAL